MRIAFLRHARTPWNRAHRLQGRTDIPLDEAATTELAALRLPEPWDSAAVFASPLLRARQTAAALGQQPAICEALMEMDWGDWEGRHGTDLKADPAADYRDIEEWGWQYTAPGGEGPAAIRDRLAPWLARQTSDTLCVTHIGVIRVALALATGWDFEGPCPFAVKRNRLHVIECTGDGWRMLPDQPRLSPRTP